MKKQIPICNKEFLYDYAGNDFFLQVLNFFDAETTDNCVSN